MGYTENKKKTFYGFTILHLIMFYLLFAHSVCNAVQVLYIFLMQM